MTATLYVNTSDNKYLSKTISSLGAVTIQLKEDTDLINPVIILENSGAVQGANYVYIDEFQRYYYIVDKVFSHQRMELSLKVDVLMSFNFANCNVIAMRSSNKYNTYLNDPKYPHVQFTNPVIKAFPKSFNNHLSAVLTIAGGAGS